MGLDNVTRRRHIVAIFGGSAPPKVLEFAKELGRELANREQIVLTGGRGDPDTQLRDDGKPLYAVKTCAIRGAGSSAWIGVDRTDRWDAGFVASGLVIDTPLGHRRNFLEARMCDAAIVLDGKSGTQSELTSALFLTRPVALVGPCWEDTHNGLRKAPADTLRTLRNAMIDKFGDERDQALEYDPAKLRKVRTLPLTCRWFGPREKVTDVVDWLLHQLADGRELTGRFPRRLNQAVADRYEEWVAKL